MNLYFNAAASDPASALVRDQLRQQPGQRPVFCLGDNPSINLYVTDGAGGYDSESGSATVTPWLAIGRAGAAPTGGTFWLGVSSATSGTLTSGKRYQIQDFNAGDDFANVGATANETGEIFTASGTTPTTWSNGSTLIEITTDVAYSASAATLLAALEATQAIATGALTVTKSGDAPVWQIEWTTVGDKFLTIGGGSSLTPASSVVVSTLRAGTSVLTEQQLIRLSQTPYALQTTWSTITNGWNARLDLNTRGLLEALDGAGSVSLTLELQLVDASNNIRTVGQIDCTVRHEVVDEEATIPAPLPSYLTATDSRLEFAQNRYAVTALTGGGTALDGLATGTTASPTIATNSFVALDLAGILYFYRLETGTDAESSPSVIRPDDYNASTNARVWKRQTVFLHQLYVENPVSATTPTATNLNSFAIGSGADATGDYTISLGTDSSAISANDVALGRNANAAGSYSAAIGYGSTARLASQTTFGSIHSGGFTEDEPFSLFHLGVVTTDATQTELLFAAAHRFILENNSTVSFSVHVTARRTDADGGNDAWEFKGLIHRDANAASTTLDALQVNQIGSTVWDVSVDADTTNGALRVRVTGESAKTIRWSCTLHAHRISE